MNFKIKKRKRRERFRHMSNFKFVKIAELVDNRASRYLFKTIKLVFRHLFRNLEWIGIQTTTLQAVIQSRDILDAWMGGLVHFWCHHRAAHRASVR